MQQPTATRTGGNAATWAGFMAAAFGLVGLIGVFATWAGPVPYERAMKREATLDQVLVTPAAGLPALRDALDDSADAVLSGPGTLSERVAHERVAMRARFAAQGDYTAGRLRLLIVFFTLAGAGVGAVLVGLARR